VFLTSPASSFAQPATIAVRGKIASLTGQELIVSSANGDVKTILTDKTVIRAETPIQLSEISSGMYLGTTATKQADGTFLASEVHVFSEDQRGTGEGHRPLGAAPQSGATMTNANVEHVEDVEIKDIKGRLISLKYKDGAVKVLVPPNIPLVKRVRSDRSALKNGVEVSLQGAQSPDGAVAATQITVRTEGR
jgi:Domain of unknown function (DUF5666)